MLNYVRLMHQAPRVAVTIFDAYKAIQITYSFHQLLLICFLFSLLRLKLGRENVNFKWLGQISGVFFLKIQPLFHYFTTRSCHFIAQWNHQYDQKSIYLIVLRLLIALMTFVLI